MKLLSTKAWVIILVASASTAAFGHILACFVDGIPQVALKSISVLAIFPMSVSLAELEHRGWKEY